MNQSKRFFKLLVGNKSTSIHCLGLVVQKLRAGISVVGNLQVIREGKKFIKVSCISGMFRELSLGSDNGKLELDNP